MTLLTESAKINDFLVKTSAIEHESEYIATHERLSNRPQANSPVGKKGALRENSSLEPLVCGPQEEQVVHDQDQWWIVDNEGRRH